MDAARAFVKKPGTGPGFSSRRCLAEGSAAGEKFHSRGAQRRLHQPADHEGRHAKQDRFLKADEARRREHDALLNSLQLFTITAKQAQEEKLLAKGSVIEWTHGMDAKQLISNAGKILVFSQQTLANERDYIKDWAIAADFDSQLKDMLAQQPQAAE